MSPLKDQTVYEEETKTLTCKLSRPDQEVKWFKKGYAMAIQPSMKYNMASEGTMYSLIINNADKKDTTEYTCKCGLFINTKAKVTVKGEEIRMKTGFQTCIHSVCKKHSHLRHQVE